MQTSPTPGTLFRETVGKGKPDLYKVRPCKIDKSFILVKETTPVGVSVLKLPIGQGETWSLTESDVTGYLTLNSSSEDVDHVHITFTKPPDIEEINERFSSRKHSLSFILECDCDGWKAKIILQDVNEHAPKFDKTSYEVAVLESFIVGSRVFGLRHLAVDPDFTGHMINFDLEPYLGPQEDGRDNFQVSVDNQHIVLTKRVDYDAMILKGSTSFGLNISATDTGDPHPLTAYVTVNITVMDVDDQSPAFCYPGCDKSNGHCKKPYYQAVVKCGYVGPLYMYPSEVSAEDRDTQNHTIIYNITRVDPEKFKNKFAMSQLTGEIRVTKPSCALRTTEILMTISATENSSLQHSETATVQVDLLAFSDIGQHYKNSLKFPGENPIIIHGENQRVLESNIRDTSFNLFPHITFLILFTSFIITGALAAFVAVHLCRSKKKEQEVANHTRLSQTYLDGSDEKPSKCPLCESESCQEHIDGITCFRACSTALPGGLEMSRVDFSGAVHPSAHTTIENLESLGGSCPPIPPVQKNNPKKPEPESASYTVSSASESNNSSNRSISNKQTAKTSSRGTEMMKLPASFVPTTITATTGYCRGGLFISRGENMEKKFDPPDHNQAQKNMYHCLGISGDGEEKVRNIISQRSKFDRSEKHRRDDKEKKTKAHVRNNKTTKEDHEEEKTAIERLKNKLNKILPMFVREENPKVRFNDKNIWAFEEETHSIIY